MKTLPVVAFSMMFGCQVIYAGQVNNLNNSTGGQNIANSRQQAAASTLQTRGAELIWSQSGMPSSIRNDRSGGLLMMNGAGKNSEFNAKQWQNAGCSVLKSCADVFCIRNADQEFSFLQAEADMLGNHHVRMAQMFQSLEVIGGQLIVHFDKQGQAYQINGTYVPDVAVNLKATLTPSQAATIAQDDLQAKDEEDLTLKTQPWLVIYANDVAAQLAYEVKAGTWLFYVNATSGKVLFRYNEMRNFTIPDPRDKNDGREVQVRGDRMFSQIKQGDPVAASVPGWLDNPTGKYFLYSPSEHFIIKNVDGDGVPQMDVGTWCHRNSDDWGDTDPAAISVAENLKIIDDYFATVHKRIGYNGNGAVIQAEIHSKSASSGGGGWMKFSAVNCQDKKVGYSRGSLDVCGHEYAHNMIQSTKAEGFRLSKDGFSLDETYCNIFGCCVEFWAQKDNSADYPNTKPGTADWFMAEDFPFQGYIDMTTPWRVPDWPAPDFMFYLLCVGGQGNNRGIPYKVTGIGTQVAGQIAYLALTGYCEPSTDFKMARNAWMSAARDVEKATGKTNLVSSVREAWGAIGIGGLTFSGPSLSFRGMEGGPFVAIDSNAQLPQSHCVMEIRNLNSQALNWEITKDAPWIEVESLKGSVPAGKSIQIAVSLNSLPYRMGVGNYTNTLVFKCQVERFTATYPLRLSIVDHKGAGSVVTQISAGQHHALALKSDGSVWTWGDNASGQLGNGTDDPVVDVRRISGLPPIKAIAAGSLSSLALTQAGEIWSWGDNNYGQLGRDSLTWYDPIAKPVSGVPKNIRSISCGGFAHSFALLDDGHIWGWGENMHWELGMVPIIPEDPQDKEANLIWTPQPVINNLLNAVKLEAGMERSLSLMQDGSVCVWGSNGYGNFGLGLNAPTHSLPIPIPNFSGISEIKCKSWCDIALKQDGTVWTWGYNGDGELGDGTNGGNDTPVQNPFLADIRTIGAGNGHCLAVQADGTVLGWGRNREHQLGPNAIAEQRVPVAIPGLRNIVAVDGGWAFSVALDQAGCVWTWGNNQWNQLGVADIPYSDAPLKLTELITPGSPSRVQASDGVYPDRVSITWNRASAAERYTIWRAEQNDSSQARAIGTSAQTFFSDGSANPGAQYTYWVTGSMGNMNGPFSASDTGYIKPITGVSASDGTFPDRVQITWNPAGGAGLVTYRVRGALSRDFNAATNIGQETSLTQLNDFTAKPGIRKWYWVEVVQGQGPARWSDPDSGYIKMTTKDVRVEPQDSAVFYGFKGGPFELRDGNIDWVSPSAWFTIDNHQKGRGFPFFQPAPPSYWTATSQANWLSIKPGSGSAKPGVLDYIEITPSPAANQLLMGDYYDTIRIEYTCGGQTLVETRMVELHVLGINYVDANSATPQSPYGSWATAAHTIQEAVNAAQPGNIILVADGIYPENVLADFAERVPITINSMFGAQNCIIDGGGQSTCLTASGVTVNGFTLENGLAGMGGGAFLENARLLNSRVQYNQALFGGGVYLKSGEMKNCLVVDNALIDSNGEGGGIVIEAGTVNNCTVADNQVVDWGWGIDILGQGSVAVNNTIIWRNQGDPPAFSLTQQRAFNHCCLSINLPAGNKCISANPWFVTGRVGHYYLNQAPCQRGRSPCVDAGDGKNNLMWTTRTDEVADKGTVDIGYHYPANVGNYIGGTITPISGGAYEQY